MVTAGPNNDTTWVIATSVEDGRKDWTCAQNEVEPPAVAGSPAVDCADAMLIHPPHPTVAIVADAILKPSFITLLQKIKWIVVLISTIDLRIIEVYLITL